MKCEYYQHLIVLKTSRLINEKQEDELKTHLPDCEKCKEYELAQNDLSTILNSVKNINPELENQQEITNNVMMGIEGENKKSVGISINHFVDHILYYLSHKIVKYSLSFATFVLAVVFIVQQNELNNELKGLKVHIEATKNTSRKTSDKTISKIKLLENQPNFMIDKKRFIESITLEDLDEMINNFNELKTENEMLKDMLNDSLLNKFNELKQEIYKKKKSQEL